MKIKLTGTSFRDNRFEIPIGDRLLSVIDPEGMTTGETHKDKNAIAVYFYPKGVNNFGGAKFLGYIPKDLTGNKFKKVIVSNVWYKSPKKTTQGVTTTYAEGDIIAGIEVECEGDFQITKEEGRTYEHDNKKYTSITSFLSKYPSSPDGLIRWALGLYNTYNEYKAGLNGYAEAGTSLHNKIEDFLRIRKDDFLDFEASIEWIELPENVKMFFRSIDFGQHTKVISVETRVYDDELKLAGTGDAVLEVKGKLIQFDWKSSKKVQNKHKVQVGFYGKHNKCDFGAVVCFGAENKQGYSVSKVNIDNAYKCLTTLINFSKMEKNLTYK